MFRFVGILGLAFSIFFIMVGLSAIVRKWLPILDSFPETIKENPDIYNYLIGALIVGYGVFRFIRSYKLIRQNRIS